MNPLQNIAPPMETNEAVRRLLAVQTDVNGNPKPGAPGGPAKGNKLKITTQVAGGPLPALASVLVQSNPLRVGGLTLRNTDDTNSIWYSDNPNVTDDTGFELKADESQPIYEYSGALYIYTKAGSPIVKCVEVLQS